jgi:hypothetical protein
MTSGQPEVSYTYASFILSKWIELMDISEKVRTSYLNNAVDNDLTYEYIARLTRLWGELRPKVKGNTLLKDLEAEFLDFEEFYYDPNRLKSEDNKEKVFQMEATIRLVLEKLKITMFEY